MSDNNVTDIISKIVRVLELEASAIRDCVNRIHSSPESKTQLEKAISYLKTTLEHEGKIIVIGLGKSGKIGQKLAATLCSTGSLAVFLHPTEGLHGDLGLIAAKDAVLAISNTGNTEEIIKLVPALRKIGVPIIALSGNKSSQLATLADAWIDASVGQEACPHNLAPTTSTTLALALGDAIAVTLMQLRGFDANNFARNHPGGSLGRKLTLRVIDVMHKSDSVATVSETESMDNVVVLLTKKKLGAVLVVDGEKLAGIITDGDVRRAIQHKEKFFSFKARDIMTRTPVAVNPETLASEALSLMENRPSQISVLPVVDNNNKWLGLIRLHDLVKSF